MIVRRLVLTACVLMAALTAQAAWIAVESPVPDQAPAVGISRITADEWRIEVAVPGAVHETLALDGETVDLLAFPGEITVGGDGEASLPVISRYIALNSIGDPQIEVISEEWEELTGEYNVALNIEDLQSRSRASVYRTQNQFLPESPFKVSSAQSLGGVPLAAVQIQAVQYNPAQQRVRVLRNAEIRVRETGAARDVNRPITETTASLLRGLLTNADDVLMNYEIVRGTYLFIIPNSGTVEGMISDLVEWRTQKGHTVQVAREGTDITTWTYGGIKSYIQGLYNTSDPPLEFVCLVGDAEGTYDIPYYPGYSSGAGDWGYTCLDGTDMLSDIALGRYCYQTVTDLGFQLSKTLYYEREPAPINSGSKPNWYKAGGVVGDYHGDTYISVIQLSRWIRERMLDAGYTSSSIDTLYWKDESPPGNVDASAMQASIQAGASIWTYRGYLAMLNFTNSNITALSNTGHWPFVLTLTCSTNDFDSGSYDLCETFMVGDSTGAVAAMGMSTLSTNTRMNNILMGGAIQGMLVEDIHTTGGSLVRARAELYRAYPSDSSDVARFCHYVSLLGDPSLDIFTDTPEPLNIDNPATIPTGTNTLTLTVTDGSAQPVENAYVNLSKGTEVFVGDWTDAGGQVTLDFQAATTGNLHVVATKHNHIPARESSVVTTEDRYVSPYASSFSSVNPGDAVNFNLRLKNWGSAAANDVNATLSSSDPFVAGISDNTETYGNIPAGGDSYPDDDFDYTVASYAPDGHVLDFTLTVTDNAAGSWISSVPIPVSNGNLEFVSYTLSGVGGDLDAGESGQIYLTLENVGTRATNAGITAQLISLDPIIVVGAPPEGTFSEATPGTECDNSSDMFDITATADAYPGETAEMMCVFPLNNGFADTVYFDLVMGMGGTNAPTPPDEYGYWAYDDTDTDYDEAPPDSAWVEIDPRFDGLGTVIPLTDDADAADVSVVVDLPFTFTYYGEDFDEITVCSNGWLAMGADQVVHTDFRNYMIPSAIGPSAMIAPMWDDMRIDPAPPTSSSGNRTGRDEAAENARLAMITQLEEQYQATGDKAILEKIEVLQNPNPPVRTLDDPPPNDACVNAIPVAVPSSTIGNNSEATTDGVGTCGDSDEPYYGMWYSVVGTGNELTASTCNSYNPTHDTRLQVWCGDCVGLICIDGEDDDWGDCSYHNYLSTVSWCSESGVTYYIIVGDYSSTSPGDGAFQLDITEGSACYDPPDCVPPVGRCCYGDPSDPDCIDNITGSECNSLYGGDWTEGLTCAAECPIPGVGENCFSARQITDVGSWSASTCGAVDDYSSTCLGSYDEDEDYLFEWTVTQGANYKLYLDAETGMTWTGFALDDECPPGASCLAYSATSAEDEEIDCIWLDPGTYYIMCDIYPAPYCYDFTLVIQDCANIIGRCCYGDPGLPDCDDLTYAECQSLSGTWDEYLNCTSNPCPVPAGVYKYHDEAAHQFIIEWSRVDKWNGSLHQQTFQAILKEPGYPPTPTGDGEILFQYLTFSNTGDVSTSNDYCTIGIENLNQTDGVQYSYFGLYNPGAAPVTSGRAILFTTRKTTTAADPAAPENLTASESGNDVILRWEAVTEDVYGSPITVDGYNIYRGATSDFTPDGGTYLDSTTGTDYTDTGVLLTDNVYFYVVQAYVSGTVSRAVGPVRKTSSTDTRK